MGKGPKKKVRLHCHDVIGRWPDSWCAWADIHLEFHVGKKVEWLAPCVMGMIDAVRERPYWKDDPKLWADAVAFAARCKAGIEKEGFYIEMPEADNSACDSVVVGEEYVTRKNAEAALIEYMRRRGVKIDRVKFRWLKPTIICQGMCL